MPADELLALKRENAVLKTTVGTLRLGLQPCENCGERTLGPGTRAAGTAGSPVTNTWMRGFRLTTTSERPRRYSRYSVNSATGRDARRPPFSSVAFSMQSVSA